MNPAELLSRLNPSIPDIDKLPPGWGGLSPSDIAASLAGLPRLAQLILLAKWAQYPGLQHELIYQLWNYAVDISIQFGWPKPPSGQETYRKLAHLAIIEGVYPLPCRRCNGHKRTWRREGYSIICPRCIGAGTHTLSNRERCKIVGMTFYQWRQWEYRYRVISNAIQYWNNDGLRHIKNQLI